MEQILCLSIHIKHCCNTAWTTIHEGSSEYTWVDSAGCSSQSKTFGASDSRLSGSWTRLCVCMMSSLKSDSLFMESKEPGRGLLRVWSFTSAAMQLILKTSGTSGHAGWCASYTAFKGPVTNFLFVFAPQCCSLSVRTRSWSVWCSLNAPLPALCLSRLLSICDLLSLW